MDPQRNHDRAAAYAELSLFPNSQADLASFGNHEAKLLMLLMMSEQTDVLSHQHLWTSFSKFIGPHTPWQPSSSIAKEYCSESLEPGGQVIEAKTARGSAGFAPTSRAVEGRALAGIIGAWSVRYPDISVQQLFGSSKTSGEVVSVQHRLRVLSGLLAHESGYLPMWAMNNAAGGVHNTFYVAEGNNIDSACRALELAGVVTIKSGIQDTEHLFQIINYETPEYGNDKRGPIIDTFYGFLQYCKREKIETFRLYEVIDFVAGKLGEAFDPADVRDTLVRALNQAAHLPGVVRIEGPDEGTTHVALVEQFRPAIRELLDKLTKYEAGDPTTIQQGKADADFIGRDDATKARLMGKAKQFSPNANAQDPEITHDQLKDLLRDNPAGLTIVGLAHAYQERYQRPYSLGSVRFRIGELVTAQVVQLDVRRLDPTRRRKAHFYRLADKDEA